MIGLHRYFALLLLVPFALPPLAAQDLAKVETAVPAAADDAPLPPQPSVAASVLTDKNARALRLSIPAPRGQIVDRNGIPFAQNKVVYYLALNFPTLKPATPERILAFAHERITSANTLLGKTWSLPDAKLLQHYQYRRWLPLAFSTIGPHIAGLTEEELEKVKPLLDQGLLLQPAYMRFYPKHSSACHLIGYTGMTRPLPLGVIVEGDPLFQEPEGRSGLEAKFDARLKGTPGSINLLFDPNGKELHREILRNPVPGHNVVTTLDYNMQSYAESALKRHASRGGAMVIMDVRNGAVLAMASNPMFDLNDFIPGIPEAEFLALNTNVLTPLLGRAFQSAYPPASTFKIVSALAALESGAVTSSTAFDCDTVFQIGDRAFHNHSKNDEGPMNVITAIKRSCNTWFYQAGLATGSGPVVAMAQRMGFGERTGLPISEEPGFMPTDAITQAKLGHKILGGDLANICIGQGMVLASPLQVAQCMATLADGTNMPQVRLVQQVQDVHDHIVDAYPPAVRRRVDLKPDARDAVIRGMVAVVSGEGGTGHNAAIKHAQIAGKTGTGQWKVYEDNPDKNRNLAWFAGFLPANNPVFSFAVLYEGSPGERVGGGAIAAPIVEEVFNKIYENAPPDDPLIAASKDIPKAIEVDEGTTDGVTPAAEQVAPPPPPPPEPKRGFGGFLKKLFGR